VSNGLVVGIFPGADPKEIENALTGQQVDLTKVKVVSRARSDQADDSALHFMDVEEAMQHNSWSDDMTKGKGIMGDSGGTSVPGVGGRGPSLGSFSHGARPTYFGAWAIPEDEVDNFNGAIDEGRAVVLYPDAGGDAAAVAAKLKAAGLRNVRQY
jgi:rhodanese-related sulfurtransferase